MQHAPNSEQRLRKALDELVRVATAQRRAVHGKIKASGDTPHLAMEQTPKRHKIERVRPLVPYDED